MDLYSAIGLGAWRRPGRRMRTSTIRASIEAEVPGVPGFTINSTPLTDDNSIWPEDRPPPSSSYANVGPQQQASPYWWSQFLQGLWNTAKSGATLPGDVATGKASMSDPATQNRVGDMTALTTLGAGAAPAEADALNMGIRAYHASPHDFDKFDISKMGTGEGAQVYSKGLYFAQNPDVMEQYFRDFSQRKVDPSSPAGMAKGIIAALPDRDAAIKELQSRIDSIRLCNDYGDRIKCPGWLDKANSAMDLLQSDWDPYKNAHRYEVDINAHPDRLIDWYKPLSEQPEFIQNAGQRAIGGPQTSWGFTPKTGEDLVRAAGTLGPGTRRTGGEQALANQGVLGVKYDDQLSRGGSVAPTQNYSIWRDNLVNILRKYGVPGLGVMGAGDLMMGQPTRSAAPEM